MDVQNLDPAVQLLQDRMTPDYVRSQVHELLRQGEDVGGGVNAFRLIKHMLGDLTLRDEQITWAYERLKPALGRALEQVPSLYYFEGD